MCRVLRVTSTHIALVWGETLVASAMRIAKYSHDTLADEKWSAFPPTSGCPKRLHGAHKFNFVRVMYLLRFVY